MAANPGPPGWPPGRVSPTLGGPTDSYRPHQDQISSQAQHTADLEREARDGRRGLAGLLSRFLRALRRQL